MEPWHRMMRRPLHRDRSVSPAFVLSGSLLGLGSVVVHRVLDVLQRGPQHGLGVVVPQQIGRIFESERTIEAGGALATAGLEQP